MMRFTVILKRPDYMGLDAFDGSDLYVALVEACDGGAAVEVARTQAFERDCADASQGDEFPASDKADDYAHLLTFLGHQQPEYFGWQFQ